MGERFLVVGANYGRAYVEALRLAEHEVTGLVSRGSPASVAAARELDLAHFRIDDDLRGRARFACVAVPVGSAVATAARLAEQGMHLVVEHPVGARAMQTMLDGAGALGRRLWINSGFGYFPTVRAFLALASGLDRTARLRAVCACTRRTLYGLLDILFRALGSDGWTVSVWKGPDLVIGLARPGASITITMLGEAGATDDGADQKLPTQATLTDGLRAVHLPDLFVEPFELPTIAGLRGRDGAPEATAAVHAFEPLRLAANIACVQEFVGAERGPPPWQEGEYLLGLAAAWDAARGSGDVAG